MSEIFQKEKNIIHGCTLHALWRCSSALHIEYRHLSSLYTSLERYYGIQWYLHQKSLLKPKDLGVTMRISPNEISIADLEVSSVTLHLESTDRLLNLKNRTIFIGLSKTKRQICLQCVTANNIRKTRGWYLIHFHKQISFETRNPFMIMGSTWWKESLS